MMNYKDAAPTALRMRRKERWTKTGRQNRVASVKIKIALLTFAGMLLTAQILAQPTVAAQTTNNATAFSGVASNRPDYIMETLQALAVLLTAVYAFLTYHILKSNKNQITASIRPFVHFEVVLDGGSVEAVLKNTGRTAAFDVNISITPQLQAVIRGQMHGNIQPACLTGGKLPMVLPDREIREYLESFAELNKRVKEPIFTGRIKYHDAAGNEYDEPFLSDLNVLKEMAYTERPVAAEELKKIAERLADIRSSIERIKN
jgi:hypothetical protein